MTRRKYTMKDKEILKGVNLTINTNEVHAIMGPNGTGKSTLASAIMGHPKYVVTQGEVLIDGENVLEMEVDEPAWWFRGLYVNGSRDCFDLGRYHRA
mgnify:CR=1 FL=1